MATSADYGLGEYAFPRGWFAIADSAEIGRSVFNVRYFGQDMLLYRGESGRVVMLDAYCPHMGTHMGKSKHSATVMDDGFLEGDNIRCPFHAWRFGADGKCNDIPYFDGPIPREARVKSWEVQERWGIVFCWYDPEDGEPDFALPELPEWDNPGFVRWHGLDHVADLNHGIEVFDNNSDAPHLEYLHGGGRVAAYENEVDGYRYHQRETMILSDNDVDMGDAKPLTGESSVNSEGDGSSINRKTLTTVNAYYGTGVMVARFTEAQGIQLLCTTPIEDGTCRVRSAAMMKSPTANTDKNKDEEVRSHYASLLVDGLRRDGEVWQHKKPATHILQLPTDGPFGRARKWYSQFFNPRNRAAKILEGVNGKCYVPGIPPWSESEYNREKSD